MAQIVNLNAPVRTVLNVTVKTDPVSVHLATMELRAVKYALLGVTE